MSEREEYLDELLKEVDGDSEIKERTTVEESVLDNYEKELEGIEEDDFLQEFEKSLGNELDIDTELESSEEVQSSTLEGETETNTDSASTDFMDNIDSIVNEVKNGAWEDDLSEDDLSMEESLRNFENEDPALDEIGQAFSKEESDVNTLEEEQINMGETGENHDSLEPEDISEAEKLAREIESLNLETEEETHAEPVKEEAVMEEAEVVPEEDKKEKKKGFFARLAVALFGEDEEEEKEKKRTVSADVADLENISDENLSALMGLENQSAIEAEEEAAKKKQEAEEKKALKEQKAKEKEEKKAEKKAAKEQKAKEKAEKKAAKQKNKEPVAKSKPLPKKPVVLIMLFGLSVVVLVNLLTNYTGYNTGISDAKDYYAQGKYVEAYGCLSEGSIKEKDMEFYDKVRLTSYLQQQLNSFVAYQSQDMHSEALAALICGVGRYDRFIEEATETGVDKEYEKMLQQMEEALSSQYQMSLEEARTIYALNSEDKQEFTYAVYDVISELGLAQQEP